MLPESARRDGAAVVTSHSLSAQLVLVTTSAVAVGLLDAALVTFGIAGAGGAFEYVPARIWIVAPLTWLLLATVAGSALLLLTRRSVGPCVALVLVITLIAIRLRAHPALLLAAIVVAVASAALVARRVQSWMAQPRRAIAAGVLTILGAVGAFGATPPASSSSWARPAGTGPNVIVVFLDTVRYDAVFDVGGQVRAELETLARLRRDSTAFTRAYATSPWTLPSHLSAVTGLPAHELGVSFDAQTYEEATPTLAERFRQRGYRTAAVISNSFLNAGSGFARGYDTFEQAQAGLDVCRTAPGLIAERHWPWFAASICNWTAGEVTARALTRMTDDDRPFFLTLNYMDAHDPYYVERACGADGGYHAAIRCLDRQLAPVVDWRSPRRPTILAILSDHGELFGEQGLVRHGNGLFLPLLHVPMMIRAAVDVESRTHDESISIAALPALLDGDLPPALPEGPVLALLHPPAAENRPVEWSALDRAWQLIVRQRGSDALYHLPTDPAQARNLISTAPPDPAVDRLRAAIELMRRTPRPDSRRFRSLGYIH